VLANRLLLLLCATVALAAPSTAGATPSGPNGRIVFGSNRDGNQELYSVNADGSELRRLTWTPQEEQLPAWSPDGSRIAYESETDGHRRIWVMNADGSEQRLAATLASGESEPAWSPDGSRIAFASTDTSTWNLWVMNADGSGPRRVSTVFASDPAWSPDGQQLAYVGIGGIGVVGVDGSNPHVVSAPGPFASGPSWSPDGRRIVFSRNNSQGYPGELYVSNTDGSGERQLTSDGFANARASWSPDGTEIVFQRSSTPPFGWSLWAIGADGTGVHRLTSGGNDLGPDWGSSQIVPEPSPPGAPTIQILSPRDGAILLPGTVTPAFYLCSSYVSYVVSCMGDVPLGAPLDVSSAGMHTFTVRAVDLEGRTATQTVSYEVPDFVRPEVDLRAPEDGASYRLGEAVTIDFSCADPGGTGIQYCAGDRPNGAPLDTGVAGLHTFNVVAVDNAGNVRFETATYTVLAPPRIKIASPLDGASYTLGAVVLADYACWNAAGTEQVRECTGTVAKGSALDTTSVGTRAITVTGTENGVSTTVTHSYTVLAPPRITIASPTDEAIYAQGSVVLADYACRNAAGTQTVRCTGTVPSGSELDTRTIGIKSFTVSAADEYGGSAFASRTYKVVYVFGGFERPVSADGSVDDAKAGEALPLKFSLQGDQGAEVVTGAVWQPASCLDWSSLGSATTGQGKLSYNVSTGRYQDLVATDQTWKGSCRTLDLQLADGSRHPVRVRFTR
jgi:Tol biopolymer transport system component